MEYLVDTHIFLWWVNGDKKLSLKTRKLLEEGDNPVYVSMVSLWEIAIKVSNNKLKIKHALEKMVDKSGFRILQVGLNHIVGTMRLPKLHKDPFDRLLISQALEENYIFISEDSKIKKYKLQILN